MSDRTNAERQRRYIARLKAKAAAPAQPSVTNAVDKARVAELEAENAAFQDEVIRLKTVLESWANVIKTRESGILAHGQFKLIRSCLHPDSRNSASDEKLAKAFRIFNRLECVLCDEVERPTGDYPLTGKELRWLRGRKQRQKLATK